MKTVFFLTVILSSLSINAAIFAEPVFEIKESEISDINVKIIKLSTGSRIVKIIGKNDYKSNCDIGDKKLKMAEYSETQRNYQIYQYNSINKNCDVSLGGQQKYYLIDTFKLQANEEMPIIFVNGKLINGGENERK